MASSRAHLVFAAALLAVGFGWIHGAAQRGQPPPGQAPAATGTGFIAGQVTESPSGRSVPGAVVSLTGGQTFADGRIGSPPRSVVVDSQGRFFFADLAAGFYRFAVNKPGYAIGNPASQARLTYTLAESERVTDFHIHLVKLATLTGALRDETGDPVVGTDVIVIRRSVLNGRPTLTPAARGRSDDRGMYHATGLLPGDYYVCACGRDPIPFDGTLLTTLAADPMSLMGVAARALQSGADAASLDSTLRTFPPTFYPGGTSIARAMRVAIAPGEDRSGIDISVASTRATRVSGIVTGATTPVTASAIRLEPAGETEDASALALLQPVLVQPDGRFDFASVPPGSYVLRVRQTVVPGAGPGVPSGAALAFIGSRGADLGSGGRRGVGPGGLQPDEPPLWAAEPITVGEDGVSGLSIALRRNPTVSGRIDFVGGARPPAQAVARGAVILTPMQIYPGSGAQGAAGRLTAEGTFEARGFLPGRYILDMTVFPGWSGPKSTFLAGRDVTDLPIVVEATDLSGLVITLGDTPMATLSGALNGDLHEDLSVFVFPTDRRYWADPAAAYRRMKMAPIVRNGTFKITGLPAGEYFVAVAPDEAAVDWLQESRLDALARAAQRVQVADGEQKTIGVRR